MCRKMALSVSVVLVVGLVGRAWAVDLTPLLKVDFGRAGHRVAAGFADINDSPSSSEEPFVVEDVNGTGITVTLETTYSGNYLGFRTSDTQYDPLFEDLVHVNDWFGYAIVLTLSGLSPGAYTVESYHNNIWMENVTSSNLDIYVDEQIVLTDVAQSTTETGPFGSAMFSFSVPPGQDSAAIKFQPTGVPEGSWNNVALNGFSLFSGGFEGRVTASEPDPANLEQDVCPVSVELSWTPGIMAVGHDIYFGSSASDVNASAAPIASDHDSNSYPVGDVSLGTVYYWRIDEVNGTDVWPGQIWQFTTNDGRAFDPDPVDDDRGTPAGNVTLSWSGSCLAGSHNVYFGTSFEDVNNGTGGTSKGNQATTSYAVWLEPFTRYYWRIDEVGAETWKGDVWSFRTGIGGVLVWYDFDGTIGDDLPGALADSTGNVTFTKYIDATNPGSVEYGDANPVYNSAAGTSADFGQNACMYRLDSAGPNDLDILRMDGYRYTIEMWVSMDAVPEGDYTLIEKDRVWSVRINDDRLLEYWHAGNDGRYNVVRAVGYPLQAGEWYHVAAVFDFLDLPRNRLYLDGGLVASRDACINTLGDPLVNPSDSNVPVGIGGRVRGDGDYEYFFEGKIDELRIQDLALEPGQFLTIPGPEWASNPHPANRQRGVEPNDPSFALTWTPGIYAAAHQIYFDTDYDNVVGGAVAAYRGEFDSNEANGISLEYGTTYYWRVDEVNGVNRWEGMVWRFTTKYEIFDPNLILWYPFDETEGTTATDQSGHEMHGELAGAANWDANGWYDRCLLFDDDTRVVPPYGALSSATSEITIAVWLYGIPQEEARDNWVLDGGGGYHYLRVKVPDVSGNVYWRAGNDAEDVLVWTTADPEGWIGSWHHFAFRKDENGSDIGIYFDGEVVDSNGTIAETLADATGRETRLGAMLVHGYDYEGMMDDFRVYDRALTDDEITALFRGGDLGIAWKPRPFNGAKDVPRDTDLAWSPGDYTVTHNVYFGTSFDDVNDANTATAEIYKGPKNLGDESYEPGTLALQKTYYWRVDEVNSAHPNSPWKGTVWYFTTADFLIVDDMEDYDDDAVIPENPINQTWIDGWWNYTGSTVYLEYGTGAAARRSRKSMWLEYNNNYGGAVEYYSEVYANTVTGAKNLGFQKDWTDAEVKALTLFFYGDLNNDVEPMYVALEDTGTPGDIYVSNYGAYGGDSNDITKPEWHQWDIPLDDFDSNGVETTDVNKIRIGLGDRDNPVPGGSGYIYFDDIRLYLPKCVPWLAKPELDLSNNCIVDFADVRIIAAEWLKSDVNVMPVSTPAAPVLYYKFDEASGTQVTDFSGNDYHGTFFTDVNRTPAGISGRVDPGWDVNSFHFSARIAHSGIDIPSIAFTENNISQEITISMWVKNAHPDETPDSTAFMWEFREWNGVSPDANDRVLAVQVSNSGDDYMLRDSSADVTYEHEWSYHTGWEHYAFVRNDSNLAIYVSGVLEAISDSNGNPMATPGLLYLGISADRAPNNTSGLHDGFTGNVDEFKIFDYALSVSEIGHVASGGFGVVQMESIANVYDTESAGYRAVNFKDYAWLLTAWLEEILWP